MKKIIWGLALLLFFILGSISLPALDEFKNLTERPQEGVILF